MAPTLLLGGCGARIAGRTGGPGFGTSVPAHGDAEEAAPAEAPPSRRPGAAWAPDDPGAFLAVRHVAAGERHTCAVLLDGSVRCWGQNTRGQLGDGTRRSSPRPREVVGVRDAVSVATGDRHGCALLHSGETRCWGDNTEGALGDGTSLSSDVAVVPTGLRDAVALAAGAQTNCAVRRGGTVECWGLGDVGQTGTDETEVSPLALPALDGIRSLALGAYHACALALAGQVYCWGDGGRGQLGNGERVMTAEPQRVQGLDDAVALGAGTFTTCAVTQDGRVLCWGEPLGLAPSGGDDAESTDPFYVATPAPSVAPLLGASAVAVGEGHACALLHGGEVACWGDNTFGQLGSGAVGLSSRAPVLVAGLSGATLLAAGRRHTCAVVNGGGLRCWGDNFYGQLGDGTEVDSPIPVSVVR